MRAERDQATHPQQFLAADLGARLADRVQALDCEYMCAWAGVEFVDNAAQWIAGLIRG
jgi:hypothetical protein